MPPRRRVPVIDLSLSNTIQKQHVNSSGQKLAVMNNSHRKAVHTVTSHSSAAKPAFIIVSSRNPYYKPIPIPVVPRLIVRTVLTCEESAELPIECRFERETPLTEFIKQERKEMKEREKKTGVVKRKKVTNRYNQYSTQ